jgi:hypothetical protein
MAGRFAGVGANPSVTWQFLESRQCVMEPGEEHRRVDQLSHMVTHQI